jgi:hypothetical protein
MGGKPMSVLLITYDLHRPGQDYPDLLAAIKTYPWIRLSESSYAIQTDKSPSVIYNELRPSTDTNDYILVITLKRPYWGYGLQSVIDWLEARLTS